MKTFRQYYENMGGGHQTPSGISPREEKVIDAYPSHKSDILKIASGLHSQPRSDYITALEYGLRTWPIQLRDKIVNLYNQIWKAGEDTTFKPMGISNPQELEQLMSLIYKADHTMGYWVEPIPGKVELKLGMWADT